MQRSGFRCPSRLDGMDIVRGRGALDYALVAVAVTLALAGALIAAQEPVRRYKPMITVDHPAMAAVVPGGDAVARLVGRLARGEAMWPRGPDGHGYLPSVLAALDVPVESQMLVFSKTSVQAAHISPSRPRAIYFNDDVMVAHVPGTPGVEVIAIDPARGPVFYAMTFGGSAAPTFTATESCLKCHHGPNTAGVPGIYVGSVIPGPTGAPLRDQSAIITDQTTPFAERWGGWYVTARRGEPTARANAVAANPAAPASLVRESARNLTTLFGVVDPAGYLAPTSDIVALMTFEHQTQTTNRITRVGWQARVAVAAMPDNVLAYPGLAADLADLVDFLTFDNEVPLPAPVEGISSFATTFSARGPRDATGRSLRDFSLRQRLFRYPVSFLIYSPAFAALPDDVRTEVYRRIHTRLTRPDASARRHGASAADRRAAVAIIRNTVADLPPFWR